MFGISQRERERSRANTALLGPSRACCVHVLDMLAVIDHTLYTSAPIVDSRFSSCVDYVSISFSEIVLSEEINYSENGMI